MLAQKMQTNLKLGDYNEIFNHIKILVPVCIISLTGCIQSFDDLRMSKNNSINIDKNTNGIVALKEVFDSSVEKIPTLTAVGYAVVSSQPGRTQAQKRLMAIRSSRMSAMRELAEQIHGIQVDLKYYCYRFNGSK